MRGGRCVRVVRETVQLKHAGQHVTKASDTTVTINIGKKKNNNSVHAIYRNLGNLPNSNHGKNAGFGVTGTPQMRPRHNTTTNNRTAPVTVASDPANNHAAFDVDSYIANHLVREHTVNQKLGPYGTRVRFLCSSLPSKTRNTVMKQLFSFVIAFRSVQGWLWQLEMQDCLYIFEVIVFLIINLLFFIRKSNKNLPGGKYGIAIEVLKNYLLS
ncbi:hypothetical protein RR48_04504 [Papilio machaon]|uniref:Uncharacterized protein n=1 Tax=Papilio machaon TaxID=76193 RepID=A0A0N0PCT0_PAPMA|nr:hypothetical protein RR48_04504 [Papilio machaon]